MALHDRQKFDDHLAGGPDHDLALSRLFGVVDGVERIVEDRGLENGPLVILNSMADVQHTLTILAAGDSQWQVAIEVSAAQNIVSLQKPEPERVPSVRDWRVLQLLSRRESVSASSHR